MSVQSSDDFVQIGQRIRQARQARNMSQADLAERANVSLSLISDIELGKNSIKLQTFKKLVEALQVSADSILRPDVSGKDSVYYDDFTDLMGDCTQQERESILEIAQSVKKAIRNNQ